MKYYHVCIQYKTIEKLIHHWNLDYLGKNGIEQENHLKEMAYIPHSFLMLHRWSTGKNTLYSNGYIVTLQKIKYLKVTINK